VWYSVWDDAGEADEFAQGLERAWRQRPARPGRRTEIVRRDIEGVPGVRLVDAPARWPGWRSIPAVRLVR
jgi:hypothetical protein